MSTSPSNSSSTNGVSETAPGQLTCLSPAKLNLFLHITGKRDDGYHLLETVFQLIDLCDTIEFTLRSDGKIVRTVDPDGISEENDLCLIAAKALAAAAEKKGLPVPGVSVAIKEKNIPQGAGLGGGSSNAATTLLALNRLWNLGFPRKELASVALSVGADVPFFLFGGNAFATGIGEILSPVPVKERFYVLIDPQTHVPTASVFKARALTPFKKPVKIQSFTESSFPGSDGFGNDLQESACALFPVIKEAISDLSAFGEARMTGSGSFVFLGTDTAEEAGRIARELPGKWKRYIVRGLSAHPLADLID